ncbi:Ankyrin repeat-containing protein [Brazilian cedratvirus IHUMI]|uniref:Ankyrin repeat-containing protein n=1 Tax=Brazilian cedratvirus IHUMI TaxID=2126980 RepID=A0A2R8FD25_9VIRU|nr:Ankyrin repeat-containing protein [Brazilian cedratvirus IHUMI]
MHLSDLPIEDLKSICSFLGGYSYVANMVPYLRSCVTEADRINFITEVYERQDFALIYLYDLFPLYQNVKECIRPLVKAENLTILGWLLARKPNFLDTIGSEAAEQGSYKILTWAMFRGYKTLSQDIGRVIASRNTKLCQHLHFLGYQCVRQAELALHGHLDMLYQIKNLEPGPFSEYAAQGGHLHILQWLKDRGLLEKKAALDGAVKGMQREVILWLGEIDLSCCYSLVTYGSEEEKIEFLEWLEERTEINYSLVAFRSAYRGYMKVVRWCAQRKRLDARFFTGVCRKGTREDLEFFSSLGYYESNKKYYRHASLMANIDALLWLEEQKRGVLDSPMSQIAPPSSSKEENIIAYFEWLSGKELCINSKLLQKFIADRKTRVLSWMIEHIPLDKETIQTCLKRCIEFSYLEAFILFFTLEHGLCKQDITLLLNKTHQNKYFYNPLFVEEVEKLLC